MHMINLIKNLFGINCSGTKVHSAYPLALPPNHDHNSAHGPHPKVFHGMDQGRQLRWGLVGFNDMPLVYTQPVRHNNPRFRELLGDLRTRRFQFRRQRDTAAGLAEGLNQVLAQQAKRAALVLITDGNPTSNVDECHAVIEDAARERVEIHTIAISQTRRQILEDLCTKQKLGYGSYKSVQSIGGLKAAVIEALEGIMEKPAAGGFHRCVFVLDNSFTMNSPLPGTLSSKIEATCRVLLDIFNHTNPIKDS